MLVGLCILINFEVMKKPPVSNQWNLTKIQPADDIDGRFSNGT